MAGLPRTHVGLAAVLGLPATREIPRLRLFLRLASDPASEAAAALPLSFRFPCLPEPSGVPDLRFASAGMAAALPAVPVLIHRLAERLLRSLSHLLDRAPPGKGWRDLAQLAGSRGGVRLR